MTTRIASSCGLLWALCVMLAAACGDDDAAGSTLRPGGEFDNPDDNAGAGTGSGSERDRGGADPSAGSDQLYGSEACRHVDLVIAVDGSQSMQEELQAMRETIFPAFARRLTMLSAGIEDFRVATLDACPEPANFHTRGAGGECNFEGGQVWIESSSSAIEAEFACVGDIYLGDQSCSGDNDDEQPASAAAASLEEPMRSGPNANFRRNDALVVVVAITDEDEQPTGDARSPEEVYNRLVETVADDPRRMVFLGIGGEGECQGEYGDAEDARRLRSVTGLFEAHDRGVWWNLCEGRLEDGLEEAFRVIDEACNELCGGLDEDCDPGEPPPGELPPFCLEFPDDPSCNVD